MEPIGPYSEVQLGVPRPARIPTACAICEAPFAVKPSRFKPGANTCSPKCLALLRSQNTSRARRMDGPRHAVCPICSNTFERKASQLAKYETNYCGRACRAIGIRGPNPALVTGWHVPCGTCGKAVWRTPATVRPNTYCSATCAMDGRRPRMREPRVARIVKPCVGCRTPMRRLPGDAMRYRFCSVPCARRTIGGAKRGVPKGPWPAAQRVKLSESLKRKFRAEWSDRRAQMSVQMRGEGNPRYRDGRQMRPYAPGFTERVKLQVAKRDGFRCRRCDAPRLKGTHVVHHIDGEKHDHSLGNLVLLCKPCHGRTHAEMDRARLAAQAR